MYWHTHTLSLSITISVLCISPNPHTRTDTHTPSLSLSISRSLSSLLLTYFLPSFLHSFLPYSPYLDLDKSFLLPFPNLLPSSLPSHLPPLTPPLPSFFPSSLTLFRSRQIVLVFDLGGGTFDVSGKKKNWNSCSILFHLVGLCTVLFFLFYHINNTQFYFTSFFSSHFISFMISHYRI